MTKKEAKRNLIIALIASNFVSLLLFLIRLVATQNNRYYFLFWNLFLAWLPVLFAILLKNSLSKKPWKSIQSIVLLLLLIGFLPNSFYIVSDLIHLHSTGEIGLLFDAVMFMSITINGFIAGLISLYILHKQILKNMSAKISNLLIAILIVSIGFAIYLGRGLDWNSWDIVFNPFGLLFDLSELVLNPLNYPSAFLITIIFSMLIGATYTVFYNSIIYLRGSTK